MWEVSGTRKRSQHMDAKYLDWFDLLRRKLTTRRWSLGTGCDEELGVHGLLQRVDGIDGDLCSFRQDSPDESFPL